MLTIYMTEEEMFAKIDEGIAEYKAGKTKTLSSKEEIYNFFNSILLHREPQSIKMENNEYK